MVQRFATTIITCVLAVACSSSAHAQQLTDIERTIAREPDYQTDSQKYCLVVFGPTANTRVWLVQDGDTLYVDRNGNGDLTEEGEKIPAKELPGRRREGEYEFAVGDIVAGGLTHKWFTLYTSNLDHLATLYEDTAELLEEDPDAVGYHLWVHYQHLLWRGTGDNGRVLHLTSPVDANGTMQFADTTGDAPIVHFGGPLQITFNNPQELGAGRVRDLFLGVGTPGLGAGATAFMEYQGVIPEGAHPLIEVSYPPAGGADSPVIEKYELPARC